MNWMDFSKTADFWKAWQERVSAPSGPSVGSDAMQALWQQQEQFWRSAMDQNGKLFGNQPDLARQWQDMQTGFMQQWAQKAQTSMDRTRSGSGMEDLSGYWKKFSEETENWFAGAFRDKLPEQLRPHFQTYYDMYRMFGQQWENLQGMIRNGLVEPRQVWQWVDPKQYGESMGRIMGFKPMGDLDEVIRQANRYFDQLRAMVIKMIPATEERILEMSEAFRNWSGKQSQDFFPFLHSVQELMKQNLEPYFHAAGQDSQAEVLRQLKDLHFSYIAYLNHTHRMQRMVMDAGAKVLPDMLQEARTTFTEKNELPVFEDFFRQYMDRLEANIVEVMHTSEYAEVQNAVMKAGTTSKRIYDEMMEIVLKDWPFLTKKEADDLANETAQLKRRVRELEARMKTMSANGKPAPAAKVVSTPVSGEVSHAAPATANAEELVQRLGKAMQEAQDDLTAIKGIGEKLALSLVQMGVRTYEQVARMDEQAYEMLDALFPSFKGRAKRDNWARQAKKLMNNDSLIR
jgi:predicted flap endonuclease-1-like 5' DNA nuclease